MANTFDFLLPIIHILQIHTNSRGINVFYVFFKIFTAFLFLDEENTETKALKYATKKNPMWAKGV